MGLSEDQKVAVESPVENKLLISGPGTGKSFTILGYISHLIAEKGVNPANIFLLTFTRTAAADIKSKIQKDLGEVHSILPTVFTLHGFALRQLLKNSNRVSQLPDNFVIADDFDERFIIFEDMKQLLGLSKIREVEDLFNRMAANWETLNADRDGWEQDFDNPEFIGAWREHRDVYGYVVRSELVYQFKNALEQNDDLKLDGPIHHLIVDEYQDLNRCDLKVIQLLNGMASKLFCAGDDDQSIYGFRYAYPEGIRNFTKEISNSDDFELTECHRCDKRILDLSINVIRQDSRRIPKKIRSVTGEDGNVAILRFRNQNEEAEKIAYLSKQLIDSEQTTADQIIILLRSDFHDCFSSIIINALQNQGVPINTVEGLDSLFESNLGKFFITVLKLYSNPNNDLALRNLFLLTMGLGVATVNAVYAKAREGKLRFHEVVNGILNGEYDEIPHSREIKSKFGVIYQTLSQLHDEDLSLLESTDKILALSTAPTTDFRTYVEQIFDSYNITELKDFVSVINDILGPNEPRSEFADGVRIMTMHQAKGLSADVVFVVAAEEEYLPGRGEVDEERRLLYVSLTRAKHHLFITYCNNRTGRQKHTGFLRSRTTSRNLTRFLSDLPGTNIQNGLNYLLPSN